ncbi:MAG: N-acetylglucosamine kinase [Bulleidia sp.]
MVIGIDVGGTKTKAVLFDHNGSAVKEITVGSSHLSAGSEETIIANLRQCLLDDTSPIIIGYAGYGKSRAMQEKIRQLVHTAFENRTAVICSDLETAVCSTLGNRDGIVVILGTGSIALKQTDGIMERRGGYGYVLSDEGSGYAIGREILRAYVRTIDHRMPDTGLQKAVMDTFHLNDPSEIITAILDEGRVNRTKIASIARLSMDPSLQDVMTPILKKAAQDVYDLIACYGDIPHNVYVTGGMTHNTQYMSYLKNLIPHLSIAEHEPVYGCYVYAKLHNLI